MTNPDPAPPPHPSGVKRRWLDRDLIVAGAAIIVSVCALGVSLVQTTLMRTQQDAAVWPRLTIGLFLNLAPDSLTLVVRNAGVGPAQVIWAQATFDGAPISNWTTLIVKAAPAGALTDARVSMSANSLTGDVLVPGERKIALQLAGEPAKWVYAASTRIGLQVCYCSVFDRCWQIENRSIGAPNGASRVISVPACTRPTTPLV